MICPCCMEDHAPQIVTTTERNIFRGVSVEFPVTYHYCPRADEAYEDEAQMNKNHAAMKEAYMNSLQPDAGACVTHHLVRDGPG